jgi:vacuolar-type H+-ATPase subunit H
MNPHSPESSEAFPEKENYTDEEVEELVTKAEKLWEKALAARKLAEDLSEQADKLADEIESKVSYPAQKPVQIII